MSRAPLYAPAPGDLAHRVCTWFMRNRSELLTAADIARMFDISSPHVARKQLEPAVEHQLLQEVSPGGHRVYQAGPKLDELPLAIPTTKDVGVSMRTTSNAATTPATTTQPTGTAPAKKRKSPTPLPALDLTKITIDIGVAKPAPRSVNADVYLPIIAKLKPGNSVLLPTPHAKRLIDVARKQGAEKKPVPTYSIRRVDDTSSRVWRDA